MRHEAPGKLYLLGAGGHAREIAWLCRSIWGGEVRMVHLVDDASHLKGGAPGMDIRLMSQVPSGEGGSFIASVGSPVLRCRLARAAIERGLEPMVVVDPRAVVSESVRLGLGAVVCAGSVLTTDVVLDEHVHINVACTVGHDTEIGAFSTLSPGVHIAGHVKIGRGVFVGIGAIISNGSRGAPMVIGDNAVIGAGACVLKDVIAGSTVVGVPAVPIARSNR